MYKVIAEHSGETFKDYGNVESLENAYDKIAEIDGPDPMDDPQWPEGCDAVVINLETGDTVHLVADCWEDCSFDQALMLVEHLNYEGIRDQDGWETLELTVRAKHAPELASEILGLLNVSA